jgi:hypothetical protein
MGGIPFKLAFSILPLAPAFGKGRFPALYGIPGLSRSGRKYDVHHSGTSRQRRATTPNAGRVLRCRDAAIAQVTEAALRRLHDLARGSAPLTYRHSSGLNPAIRSGPERTEGARDDERYTAAIARYEANCYELFAWSRCPWPASQSKLLIGVTEGTQPRGCSSNAPHIPA